VRIDPVPGEDGEAVVLELYEAARHLELVDAPVGHVYLQRAGFEIGHVGGMVLKYPDLARIGRENDMVDGPRYD